VALLSTTKAAACGTVGIIKCCILAVNCLVICSLITTVPKDGNHCQKLTPACVLQVLDVLANPNAPTQLLAAKLRFVAAAVTRQKRAEFAEWLDDGVFERLLDILRRLPDLGLSDNEAAEVCAAAAAGISNVIQGAAVFRSTDQLQASVIPPPDTLRKAASCVHVLRALVRYGLEPCRVRSSCPLGVKST
jgi:hypothetical protein